MTGVLIREEENSRRTEPQTHGVREQMEIEISYAGVRRGQQVVRAAADSFWKEPTLHTLNFKPLAPRIVIAQI